MNDEVLYTTTQRTHRNPDRLFLLTIRDQAADQLHIAGFRSEAEANEHAISRVSKILESLKQEEEDWGWDWEGPEPSEVNANNVVDVASDQDIDVEIREVAFGETISSDLY